MIDVLLELLRGGAFDEWNEQLSAVAIMLLLLASVVRFIGRAKFRLDLTKIAKVWIKHKEERALRNGNSMESASNVATNPHPKLNVLLEELVEEFHDFRSETDESFRELRDDFADSQRTLKREIRAEFDEEVKLLRTKISELN